MLSKTSGRRIATTALVAVLSLSFGSSAMAAPNVDAQGQSTGSNSIANRGSITLPAEDGDHSHNDADENGDLHSNANSIHHRTESTETCTQPGVDVEDADHAHNDADVTGDLNSSDKSIHHRNDLPTCPGGGGDDGDDNSNGGGNGGGGSSNGGGGSTTPTPTAETPAKPVVVTPTTPTVTPTPITPAPVTPAGKPVQRGKTPKSVNSGSLTANYCPSAKVSAPTIGSIKVGSIRVPLAPVTMAANGVLTPLGSAAIASVSRAHQPLSATEGTTLIAWHSTFGRNCNGALNVLLNKRVGDTFSMRASTGKVTTFRVTKSTTVAKGAYPASWFRMSGPRQLVLMTCANLVHGKYLSNRVVVAVPVTK